MQSVVMSTSKKTTTVGYGMGGQRSKKRTGKITQSVRLTVADNNLMHKVAKGLNRSFNSWAATTLINEAVKIAKRKGIQQKEVTIG